MNYFFGLEKFLARQAHWFVLSLTIICCDISLASDLAVSKIQDNVYAITGPLNNRTKDNLANNATFGFITGNDSILLIDPGGTYKGAKAIHDAIKTVSSKPVKYVINTGTQDHRWLGNSYFKEKGATIIAAEAAVAGQKRMAQDIFIMLGNLVGDAGLKGTSAVYADTVFGEKHTMTFSGIKIEIYFAGPAHSPGDSYVWLPEQKIVFTGDVFYTGRILSLMSFSNSKGWVQACEQIIKLNPKTVVPGHGAPVTIKEAKSQTYDYLLFLRNTVRAFMNAGGGIEDVGKLDQSQYSFLENYKDLKGRNIQKVYEELEFE